MVILSSEHLRGPGRAQSSLRTVPSLSRVTWRLVLVVVFLWEGQGTHAEEEGSPLCELSTQDWAQGPGRWWTLLLVSVFTTEK